MKTWFLVQFFDEKTGENGDVLIDVFRVYMTSLVPILV